MSTEPPSNEICKHLDSNLRHDVDFKLYESYMKKINPLRLTLVLIPIAIVLTLMVRYFIVVFFDNALHPAFTLIIYVIVFSMLKLMSEKKLGQAITADKTADEKASDEKTSVDKAMSRGRYDWFFFEEK